MEEKVFKIDANTQPAIQSVNDLRKALKAVKDEMVGLEEGSDAWLKLANKAGEYKHTLDEVNQSIKGASSDFGDIVGNISSVGAGMVGAFQSAKAALSMFGVESEEVTKSIQTMQNLMAMTQGLASIDAGIKAFKKLTATVKASTVAMRVLNAVMTPKVLLPVVVAVTAISAAVSQLTKNIKESRAEAEKALNIQQTVISIGSEVSATYAKESNELRTLLSLAADEEKSMATRTQACALLNKKYDGLNATIDENTNKLSVNIGKVQELFNIMESMGKGEAALKKLNEQEQILLNTTLEINKEEEKIARERDRIAKANERTAWAGRYATEYLESTDVYKAAMARINELNKVKEAAEETKKAIQEAYGSDIVNSIAGGSKEANNLAEENIKLRLKQTQGTSEYIKVLRDLMVLQKERISGTSQLIDELKKQKLAGEEAVAQAAILGISERELITLQLQLIDTQEKIRKGYIDMFKNAPSISKVKDELTSLKGVYREYLLEEARRTGVVVSNDSETGTKLTWLSEEQQSKIAKMLGMTKEQLNEIFSIANDRIIELQKLARQAASKEVTQLDTIKNDLSDVSSRMKDIRSRFKENYKDREDYMKLEIERNNLLKMQFNTEEKLAKLQRDASGKEYTVLESVNLEISDITKHQGELVAQFGEAYKSSEEYLSLQVRVNELTSRRDSLIKQEYYDEVELAKLRRTTSEDYVTATDKELRDLDEMKAERADLNKLLEELTQKGGENFKTTKEYYQLLLRIYALDEQISENEKKRNQTNTENQQDEIERMHRIALLKLEIASGNTTIDSLTSQIELEKQFLSQLEEGSEEYLTQVRLVKQLEHEIKALKLSYVSLASDGLGFVADMLGEIGGLYDTTTKDGFEKEKKFAIAQTIMNGIAGTINAITSWMNPSNAWMTAPVQAAMAAANAATIAITTGIQVAKIARTSFEGGGGVSSSSVGSLTLVPPTEYTSLVQGSEIERKMPNDKMYVAVTEIKEVSDRVDVAETESQY